ncbi:thiol-disulfide oxidoreductase DCC family protein [Brevundimonas sp.]|uniref:thiol-disulfide oxidoreductase DCC family protein n=1 Tax=Brevundimonas sp. TaxID=1871086 RepID=UPI002618CFEE|nr:DUF393 domain-containing protein [Brevundimonas sp.]
MFRGGGMTRAKDRVAVLCWAMSTLEVWFDGDCPLCRREIALLRRLDRKGAIVFTDVASGEGYCPIDRTELLSRFHAREDGRLVSGAEAFAAMWRAIPVLAPLGRLARNRRVLAGLEQLYLAFLRVRPGLQRAMGRRG